MSNRDDNGRRPPPDDRTLLDPLSNDELEALRQARQRLQAQRKSAGREGQGQGHGPAQGQGRPQMVVGPDDEQLGHAPTRAMPALPSFEGKVSLDQIRRESDPQVSSPSSRSAPPRGAAPSEPMSVYSGTVGPVADPAETGDEPTLAPGYRTPLPGGGVPSPAGEHPTAGPTGFGESTLMWMQPPKAGPTSGPATVDVLAETAPPPVSATQRLKGVLAFLAAVILVGGIGLATLYGGDSGVIELLTEPPGALVSIDGQLQSERTPVKLTMSEGAHTLELSLEGYAPKTVEVIVDPERPKRENVALDPMSAAGLMTVGVAVQPVSARIAVDGRIFEGKRSIKVANLDPSRAHTIVVEAPGYKRIEKRVAEGELKESYNFVLQTDPDARPE